MKAVTAHQRGWDGPHGCCFRGAFSILINLDSFSLKKKFHHGRTYQTAISSPRRGTFHEVKQFPHSVAKAVQELNVFVGEPAEVRQKRVLEGNQRLRAEHPVSLQPKCGVAVRQA